MYIESCRVSAPLTVAPVLMLGCADVVARCPPGTLTGEVTRVRDGDTIEAGGVPVRLQGLAAPV